MTNDIANRISKVENEIIHIKATQRTQVDSYIFYTYRTENFYDEITDFSWTKKITFCPTSAKYGEYICDFLIYSPGWKSINYEIDYNEYNVIYANVTTMTLDTTWYYEELNKVYIICRTNVKGILKVE